MCIFNRGSNRGWADIQGKPLLLFQSNFLGFIFQKGLDTGFKFQIGLILDSDLGFQGPSILVTLCAKFSADKL